jgi:NAD+ synthetase
MLVNERIAFIVDWIKGYSDKVKFNPVSLIIGVSGGVDSAVASTLSAKTKLKTIAVSMPIRQNNEQHHLSLQHLEWLKSKYNNVETKIIELDHVFNSFEKEMSEYENKLAFANSRSRLRMITLYQIAQSSNGIVVEPEIK